MGGWSLGAIIAYEMSQQLTSRGYEVQSLYLFDQDPLLTHRGEGVNEEAIEAMIQMNVSGSISDDYKMKIKK